MQLHIHLLVGDSKRTIELSRIWMVQCCYMFYCVVMSFLVRVTEMWRNLRTITARSHSATHCNPRQPIVTHGNTRQHTATHGSTLKYITTHCNTLQHMATHCNTLCIVSHCMPAVVCCATHCDILQHTDTHGNTLQYTAHCKPTVYAVACRSVLQRLAVCCSALRSMTQLHACNYGLCASSCGGIYFVFI